MAREIDWPVPIEVVGGTYAVLESIHDYTSRLIDPIALFFNPERLYLTELLQKVL